MSRKICAMLSILALVFSTTAGAMASSADEYVYRQVDPLYGVLEENEVAGMFYMRIPFGGPVHGKKRDAHFGFALKTRLPSDFSHMRFGDSIGVATLVDLRFNGRGIEDFRVNGLSMNDSIARLNAAESGASGWVTYGLMALAIGAVAVLVLTSSGDTEQGFQGAGTGTGCGPNGGFGNTGTSGAGVDPDEENPFVPTGAGDGMGDGNCFTDAAVEPDRLDGTGPGAGDGSGPGAGDGSGNRREGFVGDGTEGGGDGGGDGGGGGGGDGGG